ncbi:Ltp family lipoprotein [Erysipelothrix sp. Poltava]|nr:Ltp family lipoprotein [Erysipelothrix sp. Poltava]
MKTIQHVPLTVQIQIGIYKLAQKAQDYLNYTSFSRDGLIEQLEFEGFSSEEALYGVEKVGY